MKKIISLILSMVLLISVSSIPAFSAGMGTMVTAVMIGTDFENFTDDEYSLPYLTGSDTPMSGGASGGVLLPEENVTGYDGEESTVGVMEAPAGDTVAKPWISFSPFELGNVFLEFDFMPVSPIYGDFLELDFLRPGGSTLALKMISADYANADEGGTFTFKNTSNNVVDTMEYELNKWYHVEIRFEDATSSDALKERIYYFVTINGEEVVNRDDRDSQNRSINFACWNNGSTLRNAKFTLNSTKGDSKVYFDNINVKKTYVQADVSESELADGKIEIGFDKEIKSDSIEGNVKLFEGREKREIPFSYEVNEEILTITPDFPFKEGYSYRIELTEGVKCIEGGAIFPYAEEFLIPIENVNVSEFLFSEESASDIEEGISASIKLDNAGEGKIYGLLSLYKDSSLVAHELKELSAQNMNFSVAGEGDGAVFCLLDDALVPMCEPWILEGSILSLEPSGVKTEDEIKAVYSIEDSSITISGKTGAYESVFVGCALSESVTEGDGEKLFSFEKFKENAENAEGLSIVGYTVSDAEGYFELCFKKDVERFNTGKYTAVVIKGGVVFNCEYEYTNPTQLERELGKINDETDSQEMMALVVGNVGIFELDLTDYEESKATKVGSLLINARPEGGYLTPAELKKALNKAICVSLITKKDKAMYLLNKYGADFGFDMEVFSLLPSSEYAVSIISKKEYSSFEAFEKAFSDSQVVCKVAFAETTGESKQLITVDHADSIGSFEDEDIAKKYNSIKEKKNVFSKLLDKNFESISEIKEAFESAVKSVYSAENSAKKPSGGGGGGGGGGTVSTKKVESMKQEKTELKKIVFDDISGVKWAEESIMGLFNKGIIQGDGNGKFRPDDSISREELVKILVCAFEIYDENAQSSFGDIKADHWSYKYVSSAVQKGLIQGMGQNEFGKGVKMSRQDLMTVIYRFAQGKGMIPDEEVKPYLYSDYYDIADYARSAVSYISNNGLNFNIKENKFLPQKEITRAEAVATIWGFINSVKE